MCASRRTSARDWLQFTLTRLFACRGTKENFYLDLTLVLLSAQLRATTQDSSLVLDDSQDTHSTWNWSATITSMSVRQILLTVFPDSGKNADGVFRIRWVIVAFGNVTRYCHVIDVFEETIVRSDTIKCIKIQAFFILNVWDEASRGINKRSGWHKITIDNREVTL